MKTRLLLVFMIAVLVSACAPKPVKTPVATVPADILTQIAPTPKPTETPATENIIPTATTEVQETVIILPTQSMQQPTTSAPLLGFSITASRGNLTIHRGPGLEYNIIGYFLKGQSYNVVGRDDKGDWLMVSISAGDTAWISNMTPYTDVNGNVPGLAVVTVDPAVPAYIYNCTNHVLTTSPAQYTIEPWSKTKVNPYDFYYVYDEDVTMPDGYHPVVDKVTVTEGETANVHKDGNGNTFTCSGL